MADALQMRERCLAFEAYGAYDTLRVQNGDEAEFVVERGVAVYGVSVARAGCKRKL